MSFPHAGLRDDRPRLKKGETFPIVINTWPFTDATQRAWEVVKDGRKALDAVVQGVTVCEEEQCDGSG